MPSADDQVGFSQKAIRVMWARGGWLVVFGLSVGILTLLPLSVLWLCKKKLELDLHGDAPLVVASYVLTAIPVLWAALHARRRSVRCTVLAEEYAYRSMMTRYAVAGKELFDPGRSDKLTLLQFTHLWAKSPSRLLDTPLCRQRKDASKSASTPKASEASASVEVKATA